MKKQITLLSIFAITSGIALGQVDAIKQMPTMHLAPSKISIDHSKSTTNHLTAKAGGDLVWSDDFSGAATWTLGGDGAQGAWVLATGPADAGLSNATQYMGAMASTTAANGFAGFDGVQYLITPPVLVQNAWVVSEVIDFTGIQTVDVTFEERYRAFNTDQTFVEFSGDGGTTWTDTVEVNTGQVTNDPAYQGSKTVTLNVAGTSTGMIRFRWSSPVADDNYGSGYGWFVDDVSITEGYANNLTLTNPYNLTGGQALQYSQFPTSQVSATATTTFGAVIKNIGSNSQDAVLNVVEPTTSYSSMTASPVTIASFMQDTVEVTATPFTIPATVGAYNFGYQVTSNNNTLDATTDDMAAMSMNVTAKTMAVDSYVSGSLGSAGFIGFSGQTGDQGIGTYYEVFNNMSIDRIQVGLSTVNAADEATYSNLLNVSIYQYVAANSDFEFLSVTSDYQVTSADFGNVVNVYFDNTQNIPAGTLLLVVAGFYDGSPVPIAFSGTVPYGLVAGLIAGATTGLASDDGLTVPAPVVRLDLGQYLGVKESTIASSQVSLYPNPANNSATITYSLNTASTVNILVRDLSGRTVYSSTEENQTEGAHNHAISTASLANGIYTYSIQANGNEVTNKFVVQK